MQLFDTVLLQSFREMLLNCFSTLESEGWQSFSESLRDGLNKIGREVIRLVLESANEEFVANLGSRLYSRRQTTGSEGELQFGR